VAHGTGEKERVDVTAQRAIFKQASRAENGCRGSCAAEPATGWGQEEDISRSQEAGFNLHIVKPVDIAALENLLAGLLTPVLDGRHRSAK
jgi:hypothetical protein